VTTVDVNEAKLAGVRGSCENHPSPLRVECTSGSSGAGVRKKRRLCARWVRERILPLLSVDFRKNKQAMPMH